MKVKEGKEEKLKRGKGMAFGQREAIALEALPTSLCSPRED